MKRNLELIKKRIFSICVTVILLVNLCIFPAMAETDRVDSIIENMSLRNKITQMFMIDFRQWKDESGKLANLTVINDDVKNILRDYHFGAVILFAENIQTTNETLALTKDMQQAAINGNGLPMIIATDQEGGKIYRLGSGTVLPGNMALAATGNENSAYDAGAIIGKELSCLGINTTLAPVVDINNNPNNPVIGIRSFSDDATTVGNFASKMIDGMSSTNVIGCAKHYPGHGDVAMDSHYELPVVDKSKDELMDNELVPYKIAISKNIEMIMTAHILYPQVESRKKHSAKTGVDQSLPATMSPELVSNILKGELGFNGVVCTDAMNMKGVSDSWNEDEAVINAINAGVDLICMPTSMTSNEDKANLEKIITSVSNAVRGGTISMNRINDACRRILKLKQSKGILDYNPDDYTIEKAQSIVGSRENRSAERQMAADAVTVVQNKNDTLPKRISEDSKVLVMVPYGNEPGQFVMAWNRAKQARLIPDGAQIKTVVFNDLWNKETYQSEIEKYKRMIDEYDTIILNSELSSSSITNNSWLYTAVQDFVNYGEANSKTTIVMSTEQPYDVTLYPNADAVVAVYGCKGSNIDPEQALINGTTESVAACGPNMIAGMEVSLGVFGARGKLPVNIPVFDKEKGEFSTTEIAYERGYGLTYSALQPIPDPHKDKKQGSVDTGDDSPIMLYTIMLLISLAGIVCMIWPLMVSDRTRRS